MQNIFIPAPSKQNSAQDQNQNQNQWFFQNSTRPKDIKRIFSSQIKLKKLEEELICGTMEKRPETVKMKTQLKSPLFVSAPAEFQILPNRENNNENPVESESTSLKVEFREFEDGLIVAKSKKRIHVIPPCFVSLRRMSESYLNTMLNPEPKDPRIKLQLEVEHSYAKTWPRENDEEKENKTELSSCDISHQNSTVFRTKSQMLRKKRRAKRRPRWSKAVKVQTEFLEQSKDNLKTTDCDLSSNKNAASVQKETKRGRKRKLIKTDVADAQDYENKMRIVRLNKSGNDVYAAASYIRIPHLNRDNNGAKSKRRQSYSLNANQAAVSSKSTASQSDCQTSPDLIKPKAQRKLHRNGEKASITNPRVLSFGADKTTYTSQTETVKTVDATECERNWRRSLCEVSETNKKVAETSESLNESEEQNPKSESEISIQNSVNDVKSMQQAEVQSVNSGKGCSADFKWVSNDKTHAGLKRGKCLEFFRANTPEQCFTFG